MWNLAACHFTVWNWGLLFFIDHSCETNCSEPEEILAPVQLGPAQSGGEQHISGGHRPLTKTWLPGIATHSPGKEGNSSCQWWQHRHAAMCRAVMLLQWDSQHTLNQEVFPLAEQYCGHSLWSQNVPLLPV